MVLDNTKRAMFRTCKAKYNLSVNHGQQSMYGSTAIRYGVAWHGIQEGYHQWVMEYGWPSDNSQFIKALTFSLEKGKAKWDKVTEGKLYNDDYRDFNTCAEAFNRYLEVFSDDRNFIKILSTETKFECPIVPENRQEEKMLSQLPPLVFTGRIDLCVEMDSMKWIFDFKTTGWILDQVISKSNRSPQFIGYSFAGDKVFGFHVAGCLASFHYVGSTKSRKTGDWGDARFDFRRVPQIYTQGDIQAWKLSFIDTCREIKRCQEEEFWPESFDNCFQYGACPYLRLCQQHDNFSNLNLDGYKTEFWDVLEEEE